MNLFVIFSGSLKVNLPIEKSLDTREFPIIKKLSDMVAKN